MRSEGVGFIDEPDSSVWLPVCGGQCVCRFGFSTLPASKRSKFNTVHCNSSGEHIYTKIVEEKGPGW